MNNVIETQQQINSARKMGFNAGRNGFPGNSVWNQCAGSYPKQREAWYLGWGDATGKTAPGWDAEFGSK